MVVHNSVSEVSYISCLRWRGYEDFLFCIVPLWAQKHRDFFRSSLPETEIEPVPEALWFYTDTVTVMKSIRL